jgi:hypothetical protein
MATYPWPGFCVNRFEMRVMPNTRVFVGPYTPSVQVLDLLGERWMISLDTTPGVKQIDAGAREAFFDRLRGPVNRISMWNLRRPVPLGTIRDGVVANVVNGSLAAVSVVNASLQPVTVRSGAPAVAAAVAQGSSTATLSHVAGRTVKAGDMLGLGGQLVRVMADATFDGSGQAVVEFFPRLRTALGIGAEVVWDKPTATFMLQAETVPTVHRPGMYEGASLDLIETF